MERIDVKTRIKELERQINDMPSGYIKSRKVNGNEYYYHRWTEDKKQKEKYLSADEAETLSAQIKQRKALEKELKELKSQLPKPNKLDTSKFITNILSGDELRKYADPVRKYRKRECFCQLRDYIYGKHQDKVFILYGLRRTGKTTMIRQLLARMNDSEIAMAAFIQAMPKNTLADINRDLKSLEQQGIKYVFIDEVTLIEDFIQGAALFADMFAACGMKIVLSGTDSLGFIFAEDEQLYDRCIMLHTTFIPYREFEAILGIKGIDEYIRYGGTMSLGGINYNETSTFASKQSTDEYVDTAIARNIQRSLRCYQYEGHFRHLQELYDKNELTSAINRVVEDINHRFTLKVLTNDFRSNDLGISASNLRRDREDPTDILDRIDVASVTDNLRKLLEIRNKNEQTVALDNAHVAEIKEYLKLLDLIQDIEVRHLPDVNTVSSRTVITQPGLRYAQAEALISSLLLDETFSALSLAERTSVQKRILNEIKGRMLEDIVLLETKLANPKKEVFTLQFPVGEFDMVVYDRTVGSCSIFEIKHSKEAIAQQRRHLNDEGKRAQTEHRYGSIKEKYVLYRGDEQIIDGVHYKNVEEYLRVIAKRK